MTGHLKGLMDVVPDLDHTDPAQRWLYSQGQDGQWYRRRIHADDPQIIEKTQAIASGHLEVVPAGATPESMAALEQERAERQSIFEAELRRLEEEDFARQQAVAKRRADELLARAQAEVERLKQLRPPGR